MQIEATGKSVDIAIQNGLLECGMKREDVEVKVLEQGGLFKKAKVVLTWGEKPVEAKEEVEEVSEPAVEEVVEETATETVEAEEPKKEEVAKPKRIVDTTALEAKAKEFLLGLAKHVDENAEVSSTAGENEITFEMPNIKEGLIKDDSKFIDSKNISNHGNLIVLKDDSSSDLELIGYHGESLQAIQMLLSGLKGKGEGPVRMYVDVAGYKQNRNQNIIDLANRIAEQAIKIERNIHLDPMNAYDRRIVHTTLQGRDDVTTESTGEGEKRHVVVKPIFKK
ncbi:MAG: Jag N-terminal domain-containing protein [Clostridia bacterium]|nr:Jag N-terminal domain-containing protein [Clostridia bacterium]